MAKKLICSPSANTLDEAAAKKVAKPGTPAKKYRKIQGWNINIRESQTIFKTLF